MLMPNTPPTLASISIAEDIDKILLDILPTIGFAFGASKLDTIPTSMPHAHHMAHEKKDKALKVLARQLGSVCKSKLPILHICVLQLCLS